MTVRLHPLPEAVSAAVCAFDTMQGAVETVIATIQLGIPVARPALIETTAFGAAYLAGVQAGWWNGPRATADPRGTETRFIPALAAPTRAALLSDWRRAVERSRGWAL